MHNYKLHNNISLKYLYSKRYNGACNIGHLPNCKRKTENLKVQNQDNQSEYWTTIVYTFIHVSIYPAEKDCHHRHWKQSNNGSYVRISANRNKVCLGSKVNRLTKVYVLQNKKRLVVVILHIIIVTLQYNIFPLFVSVVVEKALSMNTSDGSSDLYQEGR